jgi:hypothetical protein
MCAINGFVLQDWEIWRQYTTYFLDPPPSSDEIATSLVENGIVMCARTVGGTLIWEEEGRIETEETSIQAEPDGRHSWKLRTDRKMDAFIVECLHQSAWFEVSESKVLVAPNQFPAPYVRGFVGECRFEGNEHLFSIYPVIKMYTTGVVQVLLRLVSPDRDVSLSEFIQEYRNANTFRFDNVWGPARLVKAVMSRDVDDKERFPHLIAWKRKQVKEAFGAFIDAKTQSVKGGDFTWNLAPLFLKGLTPTLSSSGEPAFLPTQSKELGYTISELAETLIANMAYALEKTPRFWRKRRALRRGDYWVGKPHIYVTKHHDQRETATENEAIHGSAFGCVLAGVISDTEEQALAFLPQSARSFQDFGWYVIREAILIVWSRAGLRKLSKYADANRGHLIYEQHVVAEALDYGYVLHRKVLELALGTRTALQAFQAQEELITLERTLGDASPFGELQGLLESGWQKMGMETLKRLIFDALEVRSQANLGRENRKTGVWRFTVTTTLSLLATLGVAHQVVGPLWRWTSWPLPSNADFADLLLFLVSIGFLVGILLVMRLLLCWHTHK